MSIYNSNEIDLIGVDKDTGLVNLAIVDGLSWKDTNEHLQLIQAKINSYLAFIESGEVYKSYSDAKNRNFSIEIMFKHSPCNEAEIFLNKLRNVLVDAGYDFSYKMLY
ncbi:DUF6572 domain-containing protein [Synechococcus sp. PCC 7336]|uniref:DUF6572 domain-containing protein n=1 Tax=Synechococcus sp. PCC 7336 TaxID=195250 RepID=UPI00034827C1|nr:DUF6572 domain-containing protein [Synechococcus sp. PCC 7336]